MVEISITILAEGFDRCPQGDPNEKTMVSKQNSFAYAAGKAGVTQVAAFTVAILAAIAISPFWYCYNANACALAEARVGNERDACSVNEYDADEQIFSPK